MESLELGLLVIFVFLAAFFSGSESALMSVNKVKIRHAAQEGNERAKSVDHLLRNISKLLTTVLVGNTVVNIAGSALATTVALKIMGPHGPFYATIIMTLAILIFGEIAPKTYATQNSERVSYMCAPYLRFLTTTLSPLIKVLVKITHVIVKILGSDPQKTQPFITEDEIIRFVNVGEEEGVIEEEEKEMINSIFEFDDTVVREIMQPRIDIIAVDEEDPLPDVVEVIIENGHSRIPVYKETIDNIIGILYAKDLLKFIKEGFNNITIHDLLRRAYYVPESKKVNQLLSELRHEKVHMAVVLDEYGGTAGIVTIEDLIEEIIGDIQDEYDFEELDYNFLNDTELIVDAGMPVDEMNDLLDVSLPVDDYDTLGGLTLNILGHVPVVGESFKYENMTFTIKEMSGHRIIKIHIKIKKGESGTPFEEE